MDAGRPGFLIESKSFWSVLIDQFLRTPTCPASYPNI